MEKNYRLALKFFTETKNEEQLIRAYKEIDCFMEIYENYSWFFSFNPNEINKNDNQYLTEEIKY